MGSEAGASASSPGFGFTLQLPELPALPVWGGPDLFSKGLGSFSLPGLDKLPGLDNFQRLNSLAVLPGTQPAEGASRPQPEARGAEPAANFSRRNAGKQGEVKAGRTPGGGVTVAAGKEVAHERVEEVVKASRPPRAAQAQVQIATPVEAKNLCFGLGPLKRGPTESNPGGVVWLSSGCRWAKKLSGTIPEPAAGAPTPSTPPPRLPASEANWLNKTRSGCSDNSQASSASTVKASKDQAKGSPEFKSQTSAKSPKPEINSSFLKKTSSLSPPDNSSSEQRAAFWSDMQQEMIEAFKVRRVCVCVCIYRASVTALQACSSCCVRPAVESQSLRLAALRSDSECACGRRIVCGGKRGRAMTAVR